MYMSRTIKIQTTVDRLNILIPARTLEAFLPRIDRYNSNLSSAHYLTAFRRAIVKIPGSRSSRMSIKCIGCQEKEASRLECPNCKK